jgi:hypothetical protein
MGMTTNLTKTDRRPRTEPSAPEEAIALKKKKEFTKFRKDKILKGVLLFNALSAIGGGIGLITGTLPVPTILLRHTPFDSFVIPGLFLGIIIGGSSLAAAIALRAQATRSRAISSAAGVIMVGWIAAETILVRGFSWLQGLYLLTGIAVVVLSRYLPTPTHPAEPEPVPAVTPTARPGRRTVLKAAAAAGATIVIAGTGALSYRAYDTAALEPGRGHAFDPWQHWQDDQGTLGAVAAAVLAANPHNSQPWSFHITDTAVDVYADTARRTGTLDALGRETHVGLGCAIENLALATRARGLAPSVTLLPNGSSSPLVAHVELAHVAAEHSVLYDAIGNRHTNRGPYTAREVPLDILAGIADGTGLPGVSVHWVTEIGAKAALGRLMLDAAIAITQDQQQSRDSFAWFRSSDEEVQRHRDGLTLDAQGMSPIMLSMAKMLPASSRAAGDAFWLTQTRDVHTKTAAAYGIITVADAHDPVTQLIGGRLLQRIHLGATHSGLALQHMNQITERIDREHATGVPATFAARFAQLLPAGAQPLVTFRVGYPMRGSSPSPRRPVSQVTR